MKHVSGAVVKHSKSCSHSDAIAKWTAGKQCTNAVLIQLDEYSNARIEQNRAAVGTLARVAITATRQDIA
jgi:hypothetical protein